MQQSVQQNDRQFCWEQVLRGNALFRISSLFADSEELESLLAIHALFAALENIFSEISDEDVARKKLEWWASELLDQEPGLSRHPVARQLHRSGARSRIPDQWVGLLMSTTAFRLNAQAPKDITELRQVCRDCYHSRAAIESCLSGREGSRAGFNPEFLLTGGLLQLLRESGRAKGRAFWWVPPDLLAREGIDRAEMGSAKGRIALSRVLCEIAEGRANDDVPGMIWEPGSAIGGHTHLQVMAGLQYRQLQRIRRGAPLEELYRWKLGDLMAAWKTARRNARSEARRIGQA